MAGLLQQTAGKIGRTVTVRRDDGQIPLLENGGDTPAHTVTLAVQASPLGAGSYAFAAARLQFGSGSGQQSMEVDVCPGCEFTVPANFFSISVGYDPRWPEEAPAPDTRYESLRVALSMAWGGCSSNLSARRTIPRRTYAPGDVRTYPVPAYAGRLFLSTTTAPAVGDLLVTLHGGPAGPADYPIEVVDPAALAALIAPRIAIVNGMRFLSISNTGAAPFDITPSFELVL